ncbi:hypothetical protein [Paraprevotella xylaniphila]|uniref:hypothetical protein n=1 Tax=Paraprevotella xylaniphila TaxID=454155 RepID=UPI0023F44F34|nr:hypothetical protein [Paraprevotella xylaniphila]
MKNFFMKWLISLMVVMCQVSCSDTEEVDMVSMCPDSVGTSKVSLVKEMLSATDSSFFASLLPLLERNRVIRLDSRDDLSVWLPDTLPVPEDLDFERYTYLLGSAELYSPSYYVKRDTLVEVGEHFEYLFDYFYSPADTSSVRLICGKYAKLPASCGVSLSVRSERGLGLIYTTNVLKSGLSTPELDMEDKEFALIRMIPDFLRYVTWPEAWDYTFFYTVDYSRYSVILWKYTVESGVGVKGFKVELVPLSPTLYRYEVTHEFYPSLIGEKTTAYMASVIDKVPDSVTIDYVFNEIKPW